MQTWWTHVVLAGGPLPDQAAVRVEATPGGELLDWWIERSAALVDALRATPPDAPCWCWWNEAQRDTAAAVASRQAHEALVHRWDAEAAIERPAPLPPELAADGVTEFLTRIMGHGPPWSGPPGVIRLHAADVGQQWAIDCTGPPRLDPAATGLPDVTVAGRAEQLDLLLWRRIGLHALSITGDEPLARAFLSGPELD